MCPPPFAAYPHPDDTIGGAMQADILVLGAGPVGLAAAMLFARDGHEVVVLEKDGQSPPATSSEAFDSWQRPGVTQFRQTHFIQPRLRHVLDAELPDVRDEVERSGGRRFNLLTTMAPTVRDRSSREGDERFETITARRAVIERAFARVAEDTVGVKVVRGTTVAEPVAGAAAVRKVPHVTGVRLDDGSIIRADLVIDATGRRSKAVEWITSLGGRPPHEEASDTGFAYYTRIYRSADGSYPEYRGGLACSFDSFAVLTIPSDNDTYTMAIVAMAGDALLKSLRRNEVWERVVRSIPHIAHWVDGTPLVDVLPMAGAMDRYRRFVVDRRPVVTGMVSIGDAWACTNPTAGRGISLGVMQATALRNVFRSSGHDPAKLAEHLDAVMESEITPWYRQQVDRDYKRAEQIRAAIEGRPPTIATDPQARMQAAFMTAASFDPDVARASFDVLGNLALPHEVIARPSIMPKVKSFIDAPPPPAAGPTRTALEALVG
jgi:2-polyprenyl-6-methoxyphenol hydroxylase-like FAD-dependent oxidoreductase